MGYAANADSHAEAAGAVRRPGREEGRMDAENLPETIVAPLAACAHRLAAWARAHRDASLTDLERQVQTELRTVAPTLVAGMIAATQRSLDPGLQRDRSRCPECGTTAPTHSWRSRQVVTVCGPVRWSRPWAHCPTCRHGWSPTDRTLGLAPHQRLSGPLRAWLVRLGGATAFAEAADLLEDLTGLAVSPETVRTQTEAAGAALDQAQQADRATVERTRAPAGPVDAAPHQLVAETDGVLVRFNDGWHEVKLGVVGGWDPAAPPERQRLEAPSYVAAREPVGPFAGRWGAEVARRGGLDILGVDGPVTGPGLARLRAVVVLGDGARWIWTAAAEQFGERLEIVDWYHASEHVWTVARAVFGAGTAAAADWVAVSLAGLSSAGAAAVLARLRELVPPTAEAPPGGGHGARVLPEQSPADAVSGVSSSGAAHRVGRGGIGRQTPRPAADETAGCRWSSAGGQSLAVLRAHHATLHARAA